MLLDYRQGYGQYVTNSQYKRTLYSQIGRFYGNILAAKDASMLPLDFFVQCVTVIYYTVTYRKL